MKIDAALLTSNPLDAGAAARAYEQAGYQGVYTFEGQHDPFFPLAFAAEHTQNIELITAIAVAFARNPMLLANIGYDLQLLSKGRFIMGLGSQVKPHIEKRYSMPWSEPAARMRDMVQAIRAIWANWQEGTPLKHEGRFYRHTLMGPTFNPGPNPYGTPRIFLAGVGPVMTEVAGEVGDGYLVHPFNSTRFLQEKAMRALQRGLARSGRERGEIEVSCQLIVATGLNEQEYEQAIALARTQIAFYASTPAYKVVLDSHGLGELQPELNRLSKLGEWQAMSDLVDDELLNLIAVTGTPKEVGAKIRQRCAGICDRVSPVVYTPHAELMVELAAEIRG